MEVGSLAKTVGTQAIGMASNFINGGSPSDFYSVADFYNFIKKPDNVPTSHPLFTVVPIMSNCADSAGNIYPISRTLFSDETLRKFALCVQNIQLPQLTFANGNQFGSDVNTDTPEGWFVSMANTPPNWTSTKNVVINLLDTQDPIIERFIYPWFIYCLRTNDKKFSNIKEINSDFNKSYSMTSAIRDTITDAKNSAVDWVAGKVPGLSDFINKRKLKEIKLEESPHTFPRMEIIIKFYRPDKVLGMSSFMNPNFIYKISGAYPIAIQPPKPQCKGPEISAQDTMRPVTFAFNSITCIPDAEWDAKYYKTGLFPFSGTTPADLLNNAQNAASVGQGAVNLVK